MPPAPALLPDDYFLINTKVGENVIKKTEKVIANIDNALNEVHEQIMHADIVNLEFLGKSTIVPKYAFFIIDLFSSKVYVYPMQS